MQNGAGPRIPEQQTQMIPTSVYAETMGVSKAQDYIFFLPPKQEIYFPTTYKKL